MERINSNAKELPGFGRLTHLKPEKLQELNAVLKLILALPVAREAYAQIIDGTPTRTPYSDDIKAHRSYFSKTIIVNHNTKPSDQATQQYEMIRAAFTPEGLIVDVKLVQAYQNTLPDSREHMLRLLEIAAASVNTLAGMIYVSFHPDTNMKPSEPQGGHWAQFSETDHFYVDFYHTKYQRFMNYPFGLLNVVGYWAEAEIFGGVVLFEHAESSSEVINAFLHRQRKGHAFQLSEKQLKSFADLAGNSAKIAGVEAVLPFVEGSDAREEPTFVRAGEGPLRIYKNDYDKPRIRLDPDVPGCVVMADTELGKRYQNAIKLAHDKYPERFPELHSSQDASSARDGASSSSKDGSSSAKK